MFSHRPSLTRKYVSWNEKRQQSGKLSNAVRVMTIDDYIFPCRPVFLLLGRRQGFKNHIRMRKQA
jgi:hypothetical protein